MERYHPGRPILFTLKLMKTIAATPRVAVVRIVCKALARGRDLRPVRACISIFVRPIEAKSPEVLETYLTR